MPPICFITLRRVCWYPYPEIGHYSKVLGQECGVPYLLQSIMYTLARYGWKTLRNTRLTPLIAAHRGSRIYPYHKGQESLLHPIAGPLGQCLRERQERNVRVLSQQWSLRIFTMWTEKGARQDWATLSSRCDDLSILRHKSVTRSEFVST